MIAFLNAVGEAVSEAFKEAFQIAPCDAVEPEGFEAEEAGDTLFGSLDPSEELV